jgi:flagellum-specific ATP synthase
MPGCNSDQENAIVQRARSLLATYNDMAELIRLGAYRHGASPEVDEAIFYNQMLEDFLKQKPKESSSLAEGYKKLTEILAKKKTVK